MEEPKIKLSAYEWKVILDELTHAQRVINRDKTGLEELWIKIANQMNEVEL